VATSDATTVQEYVNALPADRRAVVSAVRDVILANLPAGYREAMNGGVITYEIPLERYPNTYNRQPLMYVALAAQKNHYALYLMCVYQSADKQEWMKDQFHRAGKKLDMGKSCVRFRKLDDLPLDVIAQVVASATPDDYIAAYEASRAQAVTSARR
jgi:hypothetical protein